MYVRWGMNPPLAVVRVLRAHPASSHHIKNELYPLWVLLWIWRITTKQWGLQTGLYYGLYGSSIGNSFVSCKTCTSSYNGDQYVTRLRQIFKPTRRMHFVSTFNDLGFQFLWQYCFDARDTSTSISRWIMYLRRNAVAQPHIKSYTTLRDKIPLIHIRDYGVYKYRSNIT